MIPSELITDWADALKRSIQWLASSGIYNRNPKKHLTYGGVNSFYDIERKTYPFVYTEITAYAVRLFLNLYRWYNDRKYLKLAKRSGEWIINVARYHGKDNKAEGTFAMGYDLRSNELLSKGYSFDTGICIEALTDLYKETKNPRFLKCGLDATSWLLTVMRNHDGTFKPVYDWSTKSFSINPRSWYEAPGSFHTKISMGLLDIWELTRDTLYFEAVKEIGEWAIKQQKEDGAFRTNIFNEDTNTHAHCYTLEGLLYAYEKLSSQGHLNSIVKGSEWLLNVQENDGGFYLNYSKNSHDNIKPVYAVAQAIRIWIILYKLTQDTRFYDAALRATRFLLEAQNTEKSQMPTRRFIRDPNAYGSFCEEVKEYFKGLIKIRSDRMSSWTTIFSIHALSMIENAKDMDFRSSILELF